jgi:rhodanese-related sulfurtransferase
MKKSFRYMAILTLISGYLAVVLGIASSIVSAQEFQRINPEELKKLIESKADVLVVDTQPKGVYDIEHIPGAVNLPWAMQIKVPVNLPFNKLLILYCACTHEEDALDMATQLYEFGYMNIKLLEGGWLKWVELGYPIEKK